MAKKTQETTAEKQPDELRALKELAEEFIKKYQAIEVEIEGLKEASKDLVDEYKDKLDIKTLKAAMRVVKIKQAVSHKSTFDAFMNFLDNTEEWSD